jgi:hypothetical protein
MAGILGIGGKPMPRGQTEHLKKDRFVVKGDSPLAKVPLSVRVPEDIDAYIRSLPDRNNWLQNAIVEKAKEALANEREQQQNMSA